MKAAVYLGTGDVQIRELEEPVCGSEDVVLQVRACGICGTDMHTYRHGSIFAAPGQVLGHEFAGVVVEVGSHVSGITVGDRATAWPIVHCDACASCDEGNWHLCHNALGQSISSGVPGAFAEYVRIPRARLGRTLYRLPEQVDWIAGTLVEPMSVAIRAASLASVGAGETVLVMGLGPIGLCVVQALKAGGAECVIGIEPSERRREAATLVGADAVFDPTDGNLAGQLTKAYSTNPTVNAVCECSGSSTALDSALELVKPAGRIVLVGIQGNRASVDVDTILLKEITMLGTYAYREEYDSAISLIAAGKLNVAAIVSETFPLEEIATAFQLQADPEAAIKVVITS